MKESRVLTGYVFGSILALGGLAMALFVDKSRVPRFGISAALGIPSWILGLLIFVFGVVVLVRSVRLSRQK